MQSAESTSAVGSRCPVVAEVMLPISVQEILAKPRRAGGDYGCNVSVAYYHAALSAAEREDVQRRWTHSHTQILCATIAFGMGATMLHQPSSHRESDALQAMGAS